MTAVVTGVLVDQMLGEPPTRWHPVVHFGSTMQRVERMIYSDRRIPGAAFAAIGVGIGLGTGFLLRRTVGPTVATALATCVCVAGRMLDDEATAVGQLLSDGDLGRARLRVRSLVGRFTDQLDERAISRAVIESVAENCVDAVTAPLMWAALGGAPAVLAHRAINTLDAMVGHHNERYEHFGWASARLDDMVNYIPARITALSVAAVHPTRVRQIWTAVQRDAPSHPSPNGGVVEAAFAAALGVQLGGINRYGDHVEDRGTLGDGPQPVVRTIVGAVRLRRQVTAAITAAVVVVSAVAQRRRAKYFL